MIENVTKEQIEKDEKKIDFLKFEKYTDRTVYDALIKLYGNIFMSFDKDPNIYLFNGSLWESDTSSLVKYIEYLRTSLIRIKKKLLKEIQNSKEEIIADDDDVNIVKNNDKKNLAAQFKKIDTFANALGCNSKLEALQKSIKRYSINNDAKSELNSVYKEAIMFKDGLYDFAINDFRDSKSEEYFTMSTGFRYPDVDASNKKVRKEIYSLLLDQIFIDSDTRDYMLKVLASCLVGHNYFEEIYIWTGSGRNGKGALDTLVRRAFGKLYQAIDMTNFTVAKKSANEANSALAQAHGKRILMATEPEDNEKLLVSRLKQFSGSDIIQARALYGDSFEYQPQFRIFLQCNDIPQLSKLDKAIQRRLRIIDFPFEFCDAPVGKFQKKAIKDIKNKYCSSDEWRDEFMRILIEIYEKHLKDITSKSIPCPKSVIDRSCNYIAENNEVKDYIDRTYKFVEADPDIKTHWHVMKDVVQTFNLQADNKLDSRKFAAMLKTNDIKTKKIGGNMKCLLGEENDNTDSD